jgi:energy-coupling factor transport system permease protein
MLQSISLGIYYPGESLLHRLRARTKLLALVGIIACFVIANRRQWHFAPYIAMVLLTLAAVALSRVSPRHLWQRLRLLTLLTAIGAFPLVLAGANGPSPTVFALGPVHVSYGQLREEATACAAALVLVALGVLLPLPLPLQCRQRRHRWLWRLAALLIMLLLVPALAATAFLWLVPLMPANMMLPLGPLRITRDGVWLLMTVSTVLLILYTLSLLVSMTTTPVALVEGLTRLLAPLRWLRLPVDDFALMTLIALRFVPTLIAEADQLIKAQIARGADLTSGTPGERLQSVAALVVPLMRATLRRAEDLATALEARGYAGDGPPTFLHEGPFALADYATIGIVALVAVGALLM